MDSVAASERTVIEAWTKLKTQFRRIEGSYAVTPEAEEDFLAAVRAFFAEFDELSRAGAVSVDLADSLKSLRSARSLRSMSDAQKESWDAAWIAARSAMESWILQSGRRKELVARLVRTSRREWVSQWIWIPLVLIAAWALSLVAVIAAFLKR